MNIQEELDWLQSQLAVAKAEVERLRQQNEQMCDRIRTQSEIINRAKDINPVSRPTFRRVLLLARAAFLDLCKCPGGGWLLSMGSSVRKFKTLGQIWDILCLDEWFLSDLFGDFLVVKPRKVSINFFDGNSTLSSDLSQNQNYFEYGNHFSVDKYANLVPFCSE